VSHTEEEKEETSRRQWVLREGKGQEDGAARLERKKVDEECHKFGQERISGGKIWKRKKEENSSCTPLQREVRMTRQKESDRHARKGKGA